jgi:exosome complex RNA-binding protein Csl4
MPCFSVCRQQDVRATEIDKVDMYQSYRPGDIVRALVVSFRGISCPYLISPAHMQLHVSSYFISTHCSFYYLAMNF